MDNNLLKKLKRKPKWKLKEERDDLQMEQRLLRRRNDILSNELEQRKTEEIAALKADNQTAITLLDRQISDIEKKINENEKHYKNNAEVLEIYSKVLKNDREGKSSMVASWVGAVTGLVGAGVAVTGLRMSFKSDEEGGLINKKTLEWVKGLPIIRSFGRK